MSFINMSEKPFNFEYHSSASSWSKFLIVGSNWSFKSFGISFSAMQRVKRPFWNSCLVTLSLRRLSFRETCPLLLLVAGVFVMKLSFGLHLHWQVCMLKLLLPRCLVFVLHVFFLKSCCLFLLLTLICCWRRVLIDCV